MNPEDLHTPLRDDEATLLDDGFSPPSCSDNALPKDAERSLTPPARGETGLGPISPF